MSGPDTLAGWLGALCRCGHAMHNHGGDDAGACEVVTVCDCGGFRRLADGDPPYLCGAAFCAHAWTDWSRYGLSHATWECPEALVMRRCARCGATETRAVGPDGRVPS